MKYGRLPFDKSTTKGVFLGEPVAPVWKRIVSALADYGWIVVAVYLLNAPPAYCYPDTLIVDGVVVPHPAFGNPDCLQPERFDVYIVFAVIAAVNSVIVPAYTAQSLGRYLTTTSVVFPKETRFVKVGYFRLILRASLTCAVPALVTYAYATINYYTATPVAGLATLVVGAFFAFLGFPMRKSRVNRNLPPDSLVGTVVLDRAVKFAPSGRMLPSRTIR